MIARPVHTRPLTNEQEHLWDAFVDHYTSTETRPAVDVFLRALVGAPRA